MNSLSAIEFVFLKDLFLFAVICLSDAEENKRVNSRVNAVTNLSQPHEVFWTDKSKAAVVVKFHDRVKQVHAFFDRCREVLALINQAMFPLNPQPPNLLALLNKFRNAEEIRVLVWNQLVAGAKVAFAFIQAYYPTLNLMLIASGPPAREGEAPIDMAQYYPLVRDPAVMVIDNLEHNTEVELVVRAGQ